MNGLKTLWEGVYTMRRHILTCILALLVLSLTSSIAACGGASQPPVGNPNPNTPAATSTLQVSATIIHVPITPGQVKLVLSKSHYASNEIITVTITNGLSTSIYASANFTDCTLVLLEWKTPTGWVPRGRCPSARIAGLMELKPGSVTPQQLTPVAGVVRPSSNTTWQAGMYRTIFAYSLKPDEGGTQGTIVQSENFTIG
jgi:hypothetical protein